MRRSGRGSKGKSATMSGGSHRVGIDDERLKRERTVQPTNSARAALRRRRLGPAVALLIERLIMGD
jgi:hypothetical protein